MSGWNSGSHPHIQPLGKGAYLGGDIPELPSGISSQRTKSILDLLLLRHLPRAASSVPVSCSHHTL